MAGKLALVFLVVFVAVQCSSALPRERRDTAEATTTDPFDGVKQFFKDNLNLDKVVENLKDLGEKISTGTKELAENVKNKADEIFSKDATKTSTT